MKEDELLEKIKVNNAISFNEIKLRPNQVGMFNNFMMVAIEEAKKEVFDDLNKLTVSFVKDSKTNKIIWKEILSNLKTKHLGNKDIGEKQ